MKTSEVITEAEAALALANGAVGELSTRRDKELLAGNLAEVEQVERDLDRATSHAKRCNDRIALLQAQAELAERRRQSKELTALVGRLEAKLAKRDQIAGELEKALAQIVRAFHHLHDLNLEILAAAPGLQNADSVEAVLTPASLSRAVSAELYRLSATPFVGGGPGDPRQAPQFPGAAPLNAITQVTAEPLGERMRAASAYAVGRMRSVLPPPANEEGAAA